MYSYVRKVRREERRGEEGPLEGRGMRGVGGVGVCV